jgi:formylglycine-generating enzyme required for sulfatase activity
MLLAVLAVPSVAHADGTFTATGDVNDDGSVNISDVTALIDHLLGGTSGSFNVANADVDADSHINIADVTYLIDYLLSGKWPGDGPSPATQTFTVNGVSFTMVTVEGGTFTMGATPDQGDEEYLDMNNWGTPTPHEVTLSTFTIGQTEVSQDLWRAVMGVHPSYFRYRENLPVELMSWDKCHEFILIIAGSYHSHMKSMSSIMVLFCGLKSIHRMFPTDKTTGPQHFRNFRFLE